jgi:hypothetical protein
MMKGEAVGVQMASLSRERSQEDILAMEDGEWRRIIARSRTCEVWRNRALNEKTPSQTDKDPERRVLSQPSQVRS